MTDKLEKSIVDVEGCGASCGSSVASEGSEQVVALLGIQEYSFLEAAEGYEHPLVRKYKEAYQAYLEFGKLEEQSKERRSEALSLISSAKQELISAFRRETSICLEEIGNMLHEYGFSPLDTNIVGKYDFEKDLTGYFKKFDLLICNCPGISISMIVGKGQNIKVNSKRISNCGIIRALYDNNHELRDGEPSNHKKQQPFMKCFLSEQSRPGIIPFLCFGVELSDDFKRELQANILNSLYDVHSADMNRLTGELEERMRELLDKMFSYFGYPQAFKK